MNIMIPRKAKEAFLETYERVKDNGCNDEMALTCAITAMVNAWPGHEFYEQCLVEDGEQVIEEQKIVLRWKKEWGV